MFHFKCYINLVLLFFKFFFINFQLKNWTLFCFRIYYHHFLDWWRLNRNQLIWNDLNLIRSSITHSILCKQNDLNRLKTNYFFSFFFFAWVRVVLKFTAENGFIFIYETNLFVITRKWCEKDFSFPILR